MAELDRATRVRRELFLRVLFPTKPPPAVARQMVQLMREVRLAPGDVLFRRGDEPKNGYFVIQGEVELAADGEDPWRFGPGSVVGVLDWNAQRPHRRTAVALTEMEMLVVSTDEWAEIFEDNLDYAAHVREVQGRSVHQLVLGLAPDGGFAPRQLSPEEALEVGVLEGTMVERLVALRACPMFERASVQALTELARCAELIRAERGDLVIRPGAAGASFYVVMAGLVDVERRVAPELRAPFGPGDLILSGAALSHELGEYAVSARTDALLMRLGASDLDDVAEDHFELVRSMFRGVALHREQLLNEKLRRAKQAKIAPIDGENRAAS
jgi:CRP-like cAMP-binding protein